MRIGQLHGGAVAAGSLTKFYPDLQVYNLPLEFRNYKEVDYVRANLDERIIEGLAEQGLVSFGLIETGFAYILSKTPVRSVDDLQKLKAWVPDNDPIAVRLVRSFGVSPIPLNLADVLASLQTGLINAVAIPPIVAIALQWHTQVKYVTEMPLVYIYSLLAMDRKAYQKMDAGDQIIVNEILGKTFAEIDRDNRTDNVTAYQALLNQGIEAVVPTDENMREWRALAELSIEDLVKVGEISTEAYNALMSHINDIRHQSSQTGQ
jgi:TRAP-type C4-dicarboxylate transport system substrate-binding protein